MKKLKSFESFLNDSCKRLSKLSIKDRERVNSLLYTGF